MKVIFVDDETLAMVKETNGIAVISYFRLVSKDPVPPALAVEVLAVYKPKEEETQREEQK